MIKHSHLCLFISITVLLWLLGGISYQFTSPLAGIFGDTQNLQNAFTPVSTLFSALASCGAGIAVFVQSQNSAAEKFENNFYQLLAQHNENKKQIMALKISQDRKKTELVTGIHAFQVLHQTLEAITSYAYADLTQNHQQYITRPLQHEILYATQSASDRETIFKLLYNTFSEHTNYCLYHYFRTLYHLFKYIDQNIHSPKDQRKYYSIARAQISPYEYSLFYYNGLANEDKEDGHDTSKVYELICKHALLHNLTEALIFDNFHAGEYPPEARRHRTN